MHKITGGTGGSDHQPFSANGDQAILLIEHEESEWYPWYHSQEDLPEHMSARLMTAGVRIGLASATELATPVGADGLLPVNPMPTPTRCT